MAKPDKIEAERQRLAQRIDDDILSSLRLLQTQTETYRKALQSQADASMALSVLSSLLQQVIQRTQYLQNNLHPTVLETLGLEAALETFRADVERVWGLHLHLTMPRFSQRLSYDIEIAFFRTIQTLVEYAASHAGAANFDIRLTQDGDGIALRYEDDGRWLSSQTSILQSLREDIEAVQGICRGQITESHYLIFDATVHHALDVTLTAREREVLQLVAEGLKNKEIAGQLHLSARTVSFHLDNAYSKLDVKTRTEAVMIALQRGWIENPVK